MAAPVNLSTSLITATSARFNWEAGAAVPWTPADITTALWLDAAEEDTITLNGGNVSQWDDKSGNLRHVSQGTGSLQPAYADGINDMKCVVYSSATEYLLSPSFDNPSGADGITVFMVAKRTDTPVHFSNLLTKGPHNSQWSWIWASASFSNISYFRNNTTAGNTAQSPANTVSSNAALWSGHISNSFIKQFLNGSELSGSQGASARSFGDASALAVGSGPASSFSANRFEGELGEIILLHGDTTELTRQKVEGYLAHRWGLTANLPALHPYKNDPPVV